MSNEDKFRDLLKRMTVDLRTARNRVTELEERDHEPIAIVGIGCRYPGGATGPEELWDVVAEERETLSEFPTDRGWDLDGLFDPDPDAPGTSYVRTGSFLHDAGEFDAGFFGISPREALAMDPQQRLTLEVSWEAIERARIDPRALNGTSTGVFLGIVGQGYGPPVTHAEPGMDSYLSTGTMSAVAAGRVAYVLGLRGPAVPIETACSASLVAMHQAARSLRAGETDLALAGGVTVYTNPGAWVSFSRQRGLAEDGRCKAFGAGADGTSWAEGVGILVLERLSDAQRNGRHILAVIRGSAVNQDGASSGMTAPNGLAQQEVIRDALHSARLTPDQVDVVEAHGTGTSLGDPIEASALLATYGRAHTRDDPLWLGSIKSNIAHSSAAAGVAGVIKMVEAMRHGVMPRTLHADEPTPHVDWSPGTVTLLRQARQWPNDRHPRRAGVSSFGVSGTNAHVILEEPPVADSENSRGAAASPVPWVLSARSPSALRRRARDLADHVAANPDTRMGDIAWSLATSRSDFEHRAAVVGVTREELSKGLDALVADQPNPSVVRGRATDVGRTAFVFPGQGSQWVGMGEELLRESPAFARRFRECADALSPHVGFSVLDAVRDFDLDTLTRPEVLQPTLFAVMVSLAALWEHHGIRPAGVVGHSQGEIAAACVAGILTLEDAARIVGLRSQLVGSLADGNSMLALALPSNRQRPDLTRWGNALHLAAVNSPNTLTVAGDDAAVERLRDQCAAEGVFAFPVPGSFAAHTPLVEPIRERLMEALSTITPVAGHTPLYSTVTGTRVEGTRLDAGYWYRNIRETVRFEDALRALSADGYASFIECSPHPVLTVSVEQTLSDIHGADQEHAVLGTLQANDGGLRRFHGAIAEFHVSGGRPEWTAILEPHDPQPVDLPTYPFERQHYWLAHTTPTGANALGLRTQRHGFLGAATPVADDGGVIFTGRVSRNSHPWLGDHAVKDTAVLPGTGFLELALHAAHEVGATGVRELVLHAPLRIPDSDAVQIQVRVSAPDPEGVADLSIHSRPWRADTSHDARPWVRHATGQVSTSTEHTGDATVVSARPETETEVPIGDLYSHLGDAGYNYGAAFRGVRDVRRRGTEILAEVELPREAHQDHDRFGIHPALLDTAQHALVAARLASSPDLSLPFAWSGVTLHATHATHLKVRIIERADDSYAMTLTDADDGLVLQVDSLTVRPARAEDFDVSERSNDDFFEVQWVPIAGRTPFAAGRLAILGDDELGAAAPLASSHGVGVDAYPDLGSLRTAVAAGAPAPTVVVLPCELPESTSMAEDARLLTHRVLGVLQEWLADEDEIGRMVVLTRNAVTTGAADPPTDPTQAPVWGLLRTAQLEAPGRFVLVDVDDPDTDLPALPGLLDTDETQIAIRRGQGRAPRLSRAECEGQRSPRLSDEDTVLVTGATGTIGGHVTRHLVSQYGARHLVLLSRRGLAAPGAADLQTELEAEGARVRVVACDISDRSALAAVVERVPADRPITAVVHIAGTLDDGVLGALGPQRVDDVMRPKADGALHLHELTQHLPIKWFVMFSSAASVVGSPGQANYAAASALLDSLAHHRHAHGLPGTSISWGLWEERSELTEKLGETSLQRHTRMGGRGALRTDHAMRLLDAAVSGEAAHRAAVPLDVAAIGRSVTRGDQLPPIMRELVGVPRRLRRAGDPTSDPDTFQDRLMTADVDERLGLLLDLVRRETAAVIGQATTESVEATDAFLELGYDSLTAVELRNHLSSVTGLRLPAGLVFTHTTPDAVARHLDSLVGVGTTPRHAAAGSGDATPIQSERGTNAADPLDQLPALFRACYQGGKIAEGFRLVEAAAQIRETFGEGSEFVSSGAVWLAHGVRDVPMMICLPSILMISGVQEYARFAAGVRGLRDVAVIPQPGFVEGEPLPDSVGAVVDTLAAAVRECAGERPYVLVARSSGGWVAHAVAERLEGEGFPARALGLLDPPSPDDGFALPLIEKGLVEREQQLGIVDATRLTAMGGYMRLFSEWMPDPIETPTVVLRAEEATPDRDGHPLPPFTWKPPHTAITVSGDHFSMLEEHVDDVARVLHDWLAERGL